jgi:DNA polymerase V
MADDGIMGDDIVVIETSRLARNGHIVLAAIDGDWVIRHLKRRGRSFYMKSAHQNNPSTWALDELRVSGVVTALIRKY